MSAGQIASCDCEDPYCQDGEGLLHRVGDHYGPCDACKSRPEFAKGEAPEGEPC